MLRRTCFIPAFLSLLSAGGALAQAPERVVSGYTLRSDRDPAVVLELKGPVQYVGADRWVLYGVADAEVHVFVEADSAKRVTRLYWIQFAGYLPSVNSQYNGYTSPTRAQLGDLEFIVDGFIMVTPPAQMRSGSDREHVLQLLAAKGYSLPPGMMARRMVHLPTPDRRKELMIIYAEDLAPTGYSALDLVRGGKAEGEFTRLGAEALRHATERIAARAR
jgi:hypothetical protein